MDGPHRQRILATRQGVFGRERRNKATLEVALDAVWSPGTSLIKFGALRTHFAMPQPKRASASGTPVLKELGKPGRKNEVLLEIQIDAITNSAVEGLINDWIVPMIVDAIVRELFDPDRDT